jgi:FtsH-binding integral membrane protein
MAEKQNTKNEQRRLSLPTSNLLFACALFAIGQTLGWFQLNSQFVWNWWQDKPIFSAIVFSIPTGICFWYGVKIAYEEMGQVVWGPRFLIFSMSYFTFPLLTYYFLNESMFTLKTMICVALSFAIVGIQLFWK